MKERPTILILPTLQRMRRRGRRVAKSDWGFQIRHRDLKQVSGGHIFVPLVILAIRKLPKSNELIFQVGDKFQRFGHT